METMHAPPSHEQHESTEKATPPPQPEAKPAPEQVPQPGSTPESTKAMGHEALNAIRLSEALPSVDWQKLSSLSSSANYNAKKGAPFAHTVASVIANRHTPAVNVIKPTGAEIRSNSWGLDTLHSIINFFSSSWAQRFDAFLVRHATPRIERAATSLDDVFDTLDRIKNPKEEFVNEIEGLYNKITGAKNTEPPQNLYQIMQTFHKQTHARAPDSWYSAQEFPLLFGLLTPFKKPDFMTADHPHILEAVTPEVTNGLKLFLETHKREVAQQPALTKRSMSRRVAERLARKRLERLPNQVVDTLQTVYDSLPQNGHGLKKDMHSLCNNIVDLTNKGYTSEQIAKALIADIEQT